MRTSILSRSVIALATLAVGSGALAIAPAGAATSTGITRAMVLTAVNGVRAAQTADTNADYTDFNDSTKTALRQVINRACGVNSDKGESVIYADAQPTQKGASADGFLTIGVISSDFPPSDDNIRFCVVGASAAVKSGDALTGKSLLATTFSDPSSDPVILAAAPSVKTTLSGDVSASAVNLTYAQLSGFQSASYTAAGSAVTTTKVTTTKKVSDKKTASEKKAAKKKYAKRLDAAKAKYAKALKKAGSDKAKKAAAKSSYKAAKKSAKAKYKYAVASYKLVKKTKVTKTGKPFHITADSSGLSL